MIDADFAIDDALEGHLLRTEGEKEFDGASAMPMSRGRRTTDMIEMRLSAFHRTMKEHESVNRRQARPSSPKSISSTRTGFESLYQNDSRVDPNHPRRLDWALLASLRLRSPRTDPTDQRTRCHLVIALLFFISAAPRKPFTATSTRFFPMISTFLPFLDLPPASSATLSYRTLCWYDSANPLAVNSFLSRTSIRGCSTNS